MFTSSLSPDIALQVYDDLEKAMHSLALDNELHLLYLVNFFFLKNFSKNENKIFFLDRNL